MTPNNPEQLETMSSLAPNELQSQPIQQPGAADPSEHGPDMRTRRNSLYVSAVKPLLDRIVGLVLLVVFAPVLIVIAAVLTIVNRGRPFFIQQRAGQHGKIFRLIKFKTMTDAVDREGRLLPDQDRTTRVGRWLRQSSLDELLQVIHLVLGQMSLIGPRPLLPEYLPRYNSRQMRRHEVKPGITGWAQVNGRNSLSWPQRLELDVWYVDHISAAVDFRILLRTVVQVARRDGIDAADGGAMPIFTGRES